MRMFVRCGGMLVSVLVVLLGGRGVLLRLFVLAEITMSRLMMVMGRGMMMSGGLMMMLTGGMLRGLCHVGLPPSRS